MKTIFKIRTRQMLPILMTIFLTVSMMPQAAFAQTQEQEQVQMQSERVDETSTATETSAEELLNDVEAQAELDTDIPDNPNTPDEPGTPEEPEAKSWELTKDHVKYVNPDRYGRFRPTAKLTNAEAADMIYHLLAVKPEHKTYCADVIASTKYSEAVASLLYLGVVKTNRQDKFYPTKAITQKAFKNMLAKCLGEPESFTSTAAITRGEAVKYINGKLGRFNPDKDTIKTGKKIRIFTDVPVTSKYYYAAMEASIGHTCTMAGTDETWDSYNTESTGMSGSGWKVVDGETFYISKTSGVFQRNCTVSNSGGMKLDASGRYTTGNSDLDKELTKVMKKVTTNSMSQKTRLKKCFDYVHQNCTYRKGSFRKIGTNSWDRKVACAMLKEKKGNCYSYASAFTYLAKKCGYNAKTISGYIYYIPASAKFRHGWTEIKLSDGSKRVCDPEMQWVQGKGSRNDYFFRDYNTTVRKHHYYYYNLNKRCYS